MQAHHAAALLLSEDLDSESAARTAREGMELRADVQRLGSLADELLKHGDLAQAEAAHAKMDVATRRLKAAENAKRRPGGDASARQQKPVGAGAAAAAQKRTHVFSPNPPTAAELLEQCVQVSVREKPAPDPREREKANELYTHEKPIMRQNPDGTVTQTAATETVTEVLGLKPYNDVYDNNGEEHANLEDQMNFEDLTAYHLKDKKGTTDFALLKEDDAFQAACPHDYMPELQGQSCCLKGGCLLFNTLQQEGKIKDSKVKASCVMPAALHALKLLIESVTSGLSYDDPFCIDLRATGKEAKSIEQIFQEHYTGWGAIARQDDRREAFFGKLQEALETTAKLTKTPSRWSDEMFALCEVYQQKNNDEEKPKERHSCLTKVLDMIEVNMLPNGRAYGLKVAEKLLPRKGSSGKDEAAIWTAVFMLFTLMMAAKEHADAAHSQSKDRSMPWHMRAFYRARNDRYQRSLLPFKCVVNFSVAQNRDHTKVFKQSYVFATTLMKECPSCPIRSTEGLIHGSHVTNVLDNLQKMAVNSVQLICDEYLYRRLNVGHSNDVCLPFNPFNPQNVDIDKEKKNGFTSERLQDRGIFEKNSSYLQFVDHTAIGEKREDNITSFLTQIVRRAFGIKAPKIAWMAICLESQMMTQWLRDQKSPVNAAGYTKVKVFDAAHKDFWDVDKVHKWLALFVLKSSGTNHRVPTTDPRARCGSRIPPFRVFGNVGYWRQFDKATKGEFKENFWVGTVLGQFTAELKDEKRAKSAAERAHIKQENKEATERFVAMTPAQKYDHLITLPKWNKYKIVSGPRLSTEPIGAAANQPQLDRSLDQQKELIAAIACMMPDELFSKYPSPAGNSVRVERWTQAYNLLGWFATQRGVAPVHFADPVIRQSSHRTKIVQACSLHHPLYGCRVFDRELFNDPFFADWGPLSETATVAARKINPACIEVIDPKELRYTDALKGNISHAIKNCKANDKSQLNTNAATLVKALGKPPSDTEINSKYDLPEVQAILSRQTSLDEDSAMLLLCRIVHKFGNKSKIFELVPPDTYDMSTVLGVVGGALKARVNTANTFFGGISRTDTESPAAFVDANWDRLVTYTRLFHELQTNGTKVPVLVEGPPKRTVLVPVWLRRVGDEFSELASRFVKRLDADPERHMPTVINTLANNIVRRQDANAQERQAPWPPLRGSPAKLKKVAGERAECAKKRARAMSGADTLTVETTAVDTSDAGPIVFASDSDGDSDDESDRESMVDDDEQQLAQDPAENPISPEAAKLQIVAAVVANMESQLPDVANLKQLVEEEVADPFWDNEKYSAMFYPNCSVCEFEQEHLDKAAGLVEERIKGLQQKSQKKRKRPTLRSGA
jgi:hypothetical protein